MQQLLFFLFYLSLCCSGLAASALCSSMYRGFAECLVTLGDNMNSQRDVQDFSSICKSWDAFQVCVRGVLSRCNGDAAEVWESLRAESHRTQFSGNLYKLCASHNQEATMTTPHTVSRTNKTNQECLTGLSAYTGHTYSLQVLLVCISLLLLQ